LLGSNRFIGSVRKVLARNKTSMATHTPISEVLRREAVATDNEIPVPSATYAAKQAGHFGSNARTSVGIENPIAANPRCLSPDGWDLPSALFAPPCDLLPIAVQQVGLFIRGSHSRSRM